MRIDRPNDMIAEMEMAISQVTGDVLGNYISDPIGQKIVARFLMDPRMRGLTEIYLNGVTSYDFARILLSEELVRKVEFHGRADHFRGAKFVGIAMTDMARAWLWQQNEGLEDNEYLAIFRGAVVGYSCLDFGSGLCATREFLETSWTCHGLMPLL